VTEHVDLSPELARLTIHERQGGLCAACWLPLGPVESQDWDAHHRLFRSHLPTGTPLWCPCDLVGVHHSPCHVYGPDALHAHPEWGYTRGLNVRAGAESDPRRVTVWDGYLLQGPVFLNCLGMAVSTLWTPEEVSRVQEAEALGVQ
jgi:hypothetical protein